MKKEFFIALAVLAAPVLAVAQQSAESLAAGSSDLNIPAFSRVAVSAPKASRLPQSGTITGTFNGPINLVLNRYDWSITGNVGPNQVNIIINNFDPQKSTITGQEGPNSVDLAFQWSPNIIHISGTNAGSSYDVTLDVVGGVISGTAEGSSLRATFQMSGGPIEGSNTGDIALNYDPISGRVNGVINGSPLDVTLVNLDISDFMEHLYLFLAPQ